MPETKPIQLPPLILHPFTDQDGASRLAESSRTSLAMLEIPPGNGVSEGELSRRVVESRLLEMRMLFFVGKDVLRWIEQCVETAGGEAGVHAQAFAALLTRNTPEAVRRKLQSWGVHDYSKLFARALGINAVFREPPEPGIVSLDFVVNYHRYADALYACYEQVRPAAEIGPDGFTFQIYGSREYSQMLEQEWGGLER